MCQPRRLGEITVTLGSAKCSAQRELPPKVPLALNTALAASHRQSINSNNNSHPPSTTSSLPPSSYSTSPYGDFGQFHEPDLTVLISRFRCLYTCVRVPIVTL
ncbi:unnamed protein product [Macrosiphum euphorbiae]|uniref:Uncharacterized protein n=1 Tax=Macrosiphum euphorbiae TaxID=13131 RepID=A0AAV0WXS4_9HEMI|nr:unnamed protein product [Macrosiphum euphorbiae]